MEIGGYFGLEFGVGRGYPHPSAYHLNSARNAFRTILRFYSPSRVFVPSYICSSMPTTLDQEGIPYSFYNIDGSLEIPNEPRLGQNEFLLYVNYFGIKDIYCQRLASIYRSSLIIDNSQSFYSLPQKDCISIYSSRKFFGVPDGGLLYSTEINIPSPPQDYSKDSVTHLVGRIEEGAQKHYVNYRTAETRLAERPVKGMSTLTYKLLNAIDHDRCQLIRSRNYLYLHQKLGSLNSLSCDLSPLCTPMVYPFFTEIRELRDRLIKSNIYVATYWPDVLNNPHRSAIEEELTRNLIPLPIDQRYGTHDMQRILDNILRYLEE